MTKKILLVLILVLGVAAGLYIANPSFFDREPTENELKVMAWAGSLPDFIDPDTFYLEDSEALVAWDDQSVYYLETYKEDYYEGIIVRNLAILEEVDTSEFTKLFDHFYSDGEQLYELVTERDSAERDLYNSELELIEMSDPNSFEKIGGNLYRDINYVYFYSRNSHEGIYVVEGANPESFQLTPPAYRDAENVFDFDSWGPDAKLVLIPGADPETYDTMGPVTRSELPKWNFTGEDKDHVYIATATVDEASFEHLAGFFLRDKNHVYYLAPTKGSISLLELLDEADATTFKHLGGSFFGDTEAVYFYDPEDYYQMSLTRFEDVDLESFEVLSDNVARDRNVVYYGVSVLDKPDPSSFSLIDEREASPALARDKDQLYILYRGESESFDEFDLDSFKVLEHGYEKGNLVYAEDVNGSYKFLIEFADRKMYVSYETSNF